MPVKNMHKPISRRLALRATGVALSLPLLDAMNPALGFEAARQPERMVLICNALGLYPQSLFPKTSGTDYANTEYLDLLMQTSEAADRVAVRDYLAISADYTSFGRRREERELVGVFARPPAARVLAAGAARAQCDAVTIGSELHRHSLAVGVVAPRRARAARREHR